MPEPDPVTKEFGHLVGARIDAVRSLTVSEQHLLGLYGGRFRPVIGIFLSDGRVIVPTADPEGNGPGWLDTAKSG